MTNEIKYFLSERDTEDLKKYIYLNAFKWTREEAREKANEGLKNRYPHLKDRISSPSIQRNIEDILAKFEESFKN